MAETLAHAKGRPSLLTTPVFATDDHEPIRVAEARSAVRRWCVAHGVAGDIGDQVQLVVSELVTNSLHCAFGPVQVALAEQDGGVLVEVFDESPRLPSLVDGGADATSGQGIAIIDAIADQWGARHEIGDLDGNTVLGKVVWAVLTPC